MVLSDVHGIFANISPIVRKEDPDLIILSGDIPTTVDIPTTLYSYLIKRGGRKEFIRNIRTRFLQRMTQLQILFGKKFLDYLLGFGIPVVVIPGNVETPGFNEWLTTYSEIKPNLIWLQEKSIVIDDIQFLGFGWVTDSSNEKRGKSFGEIHPLTAYRKLSKLGRQIREDISYHILVSHAPPYGTPLDYIPSKGIHAGSKPISHFLENSEMDGIICGHIHESRGYYKSDIGWWGINAGATVEDSVCLLDLASNKVKWFRNIVHATSIVSQLYKYRQKLRYNDGFFRKKRTERVLPEINPKTYQRG